MKVDLNRRFRGFDGNELGGDNIATAVAEALFNYGKDKPVGRDEKFKAYVLCQRIIQGRWNPGDHHRGGYAYQGGMWREPDGRRLRPSL